MKNILFFLCICLHITAQEITDFESFNLADQSFLNDSGSEGGFSDGEIYLPNSFTDYGTFSFWDGWLISNITDTITAGFTNDAASFAGSGVDGSKHYAVTYAPLGQGSRILIGADSDKKYKINGMYVSNSTYSALSMRDGDGFAKKFGGESGNDPDYFFISVKKWNDGLLSSDSVSLYLADYRFDDNNQDYILKDWTWMDLSLLGEADSLFIEMYSSDVGSFGINTPTYFCVDNISIETSSSTTLSNEEPLSFFPNPTHDYIYFKTPINGNYIILDNSGKEMKRGTLRDDQINVMDMRPGLYHLLLNANGIHSSFTFIKL